MIKRLLPIMLTIFLLTGCNATEVADRVFVKAIFADISGGNFLVSILYTTPEGEEEIFTSKGDSFENALVSAEKTLGRNVFTGHCRTIFIGKGIENPVEDIKYVAESGKFSHKTIICRCDGKKVLTAENIDFLSDMIKDERGKDFGTLFSVFSGDKTGLPIVTVRNGFIELL